MRFVKVSLLMSLFIVVVTGVLLYINRSSEPMDEGTIAALLETERENDFPNEELNVEVSIDKEIYSRGETVEVVVMNHGEGAIETHDTGLTLDVAADENTWENRQHDEDLVRNDVRRGLESGEAREHELRLPRQYNDTVMRVVFEFGTGGGRDTDEYTIAVPFFVQ